MAAAVTAIGASMPARTPSRFKQIELERTFVSELADKLRADDLREDLIQNLYSHLEKRAYLQAAADRAALEQREDMTNNRAKYLRHQANLLKAIREEGGCWLLYEDLKEVEAKIARIDERLATGERPSVKPVTVDEVREFISTHAQHFEDLLMGSPEQLKAEFQRRIRSITLTPGIDAAGPLYTASGDVDLFAVPPDALETNPVDLIGLQYTIPIALEIRPYLTLGKTSQGGAGFNVIKRGTHSDGSAERGPCLRSRQASLCFTTPRDRDTWSASRMSRIRNA